MTSEYYLIFTT